MKRLRVYLAVLATAILSACASAYAPEGITGGFHETQINGSDWRVTYFGNGYTSVETVQTYWLYRAASLTLEHGYDGFAILSPVTLTSSPAGRGGLFLPVVDEGLSGKPYMVANIRMLHAPLPDMPGRVFNAATLKNFLEQYVTGPHCSGNVCPHVHRYLFRGFNESGQTPPPQGAAPSQRL
jgi:hypothetical protein